MSRPPRMHRLKQASSMQESRDRLGAPDMDFIRAARDITDEDRQADERWRERLLAPPPAFRDRLVAFLAAQRDITYQVENYDDIDLGRFVVRMLKQDAKDGAT